MNKLKVAFFCFFEEGRISGPTNSVTNLANTLEANHNSSCSVFSTSTKQSTCFYINDRQIIPMSDFLKVDREFDYVVLAGVFDVNIFHIAKLCVKYGIPYIISPRGNFSKLALKKSWFKKSLAFFSYTGYVVRNSLALHFLSQDELNHSKNFGKDNFIARNGTILSNIQEISYAHKEKIILFLGRLDISHKGLDLLLDSIFICKDILIKDGWQVILCGPDSVNDKYKLEKLITKNKLGEVVSIINPQVGKEKEKIMSRSSLFVHPSRYEGQPQAVIEAMINGCIPVLCQGANMSEFVPEFITISNFNSVDYSKALEKAIVLSADDDNFYTLNKFASSNFTWDIAASEFYAGLMNFKLGCN